MLGFIIHGYKASTRGSGSYWIWITFLVGMAAAAVMVVIPAYIFKDDEMHNPYQPSFRTPRCLRPCAMDLGSTEPQRYCRLHPAYSPSQKLILPHHRLHHDRTRHLGGKRPGFRCPGIYPHSAGRLCAIYTVNERTAHLCRHLGLWAASLLVFFKGCYSDCQRRGTAKVPLTLRETCHLSPEESGRNSCSICKLNS